MDTSREGIYGMCGIPHACAHWLGDAWVHGGWGVQGHARDIGVGGGMLRLRGGKGYCFCINQLDGTWGRVQWGYMKGGIWCGHANWLGGE